MSPVNDEVQVARIAAAQADDAERTARRVAAQAEVVANTEKFQRATYSAIGGTPLGYIGASPTADGGIDFDFAEFTNVKANVILDREQALALMRGIQNWFDME